jgi:hypothetical protein
MARDPEWFVVACIDKDMNAFRAAPCAKPLGMTLFNLEATALSG